MSEVLEMFNAAITVAAAAVLGLCVAMAAFGTLSGRRITEQAVSALSGADAEKVRALGYAESMRPLQLAGFLAVLALPFLLGAVVRIRADQAAQRFTNR